MAKSSSITVTIFEASQTVIITSGREKKPVAKLEAIKPVKSSRLGLMETPGFKLTDAFWEPLPEEDLALWNGEGDTFPE